MNLTASKYARNSTHCTVVNACSAGVNFRIGTVTC